MSERTHTSEPFEADDTSPSEAPRRPSALPIARLENLSSVPPVEAPRPQAPRPERPPLIMFDRAFETHVSVPASHVPEQIQESLKQSKETDEISSDDDDEKAEVAAAPVVESEATVPVPAQRRAEAPVMAPIEIPQAAEAEPLQEQQYASPVIPQVPSHPAGFEQSGAETSEQTGETEPQDPFEKMMAEAGLDPRFTEAASGPELTDSGQSAEDDDTTPVIAASAAPLTPPASPMATGNTPPQPPTPPVSGGGGSGGSPPLPPFTPGGYSSAGNPGGNPNNMPSYSYSAAMNPNVQPQAMSQGYSENDLQRARTSAGRRGLLAGAIAGGVAGRYFANRKARKEQQKRDRQHAAELERRDAIQAGHEQEITSLKGTPDIRDAITGRITPGMNPERPAAAPSVYERPAQPSSYQRATEAMPGVAPKVETVAPPQPEVVQKETAEDQNKDPFEKQDEQEAHHKVRSEWLEIGVDKHGRAVQQEYGRAFQEETRQEQTGNRTFTSDPRGSQSGGGESQPQSAGYYIGAPHIGNGSHQLNSGQLPNGQRLQPGDPTHQDPQHLLPSPKKQAANSIATPWFWLMAAVVVGIFFIIQAL